MVFFNKLFYSSVLVFVIKFVDCFWYKIVKQTLVYKFAIHIALKVIGNNSKAHVQKFYFNLPDVCFTVTRLFIFNIGTWNVAVVLSPKQFCIILDCNENV